MGQCSAKKWNLAESTQGFFLPGKSLERLRATVDPWIVALRSILSKSCSKNQVWSQLSECNELRARLKKKERRKEEEEGEKSR